jgi:hypothetical protein
MADGASVSHTSALDDAAPALEDFTPSTPSARS